MDLLSTRTEWQKIVFTHMLMKARNWLALLHGNLYSVYIAKHSSTKYSPSALCVKRILSLHLHIHMNGMLTQQHLACPEILCLLMSMLPAWGKFTDQFLQKFKISLRPGNTTVVLQHVDFCNPSRGDKLLKNVADDWHKAEIKTKWTRPYTIMDINPLGGYNLKDKHGHCLK